MKKTIPIAVLMAAGIGAACFYAGRVMQHRASYQQFVVQSEHLAALNAAASYGMDADLVTAMNEKRYDKALCLANLAASMKVTTVKLCLDNSLCEAAVGDEIRKAAPELSQGGTLRIRYYKPGEACH